MFLLMGLSVVMVGAMRSRLWACHLRSALRAGALAAHLAFETGAGSVGSGLVGIVRA